MFVRLMNHRKTHPEKSVPAGISLPRQLIDAGRNYAKQGGYGGLSGLTRHLLTTLFAEATEEAEQARQSTKAKGKHKVKSALRKVRKRR